MSAPDPVNDGTFELLNDLPREGRRRYVKRMSKEDLEEVILAVWRKRDKKEKKAAGTSQTTRALNLGCRRCQVQGPKKRLLRRYRAWTRRDAVRAV
jgi:hypothetical protein